MKKAFTIVELLVAMGIIVVLLAGSGYVFHTAVKAERTARATAEITRKLRGITDQLNEDFRGIRYDSEMFFAWLPSAIDPGGTSVDGYERFDQMMFFANGNFTSYGDNPAVKGNLARVQYTLAVNGAGDPIEWQKPSERVLARVQHIYTPTDPTGTHPYFPNLLSFNLADFIDGERDYEYDNSTMVEWKNMDNNVRNEVYTVISNLIVNGGSSPTGVVADPSIPATVHKILCEGVGEFIIQDWYWDPVLQRGRWFPENDPTFDDDYSDTDFTPDAAGGIDTSLANGYIHPGDDSFFNYFGRAFKFTFTLYDSYGVFPEGKTFSHIIYLD